jgi:hypothetical protein
MHSRDEVVPSEREAGAGTKGVAGTAPRREEGERAVGLIPSDVRVLNAKQLPDRLGDPRKEFRRRWPARHQRRDPPQRFLLSDQERPGIALCRGRRPPSRQGGVSVVPVRLLGV